MKDDYKLWEANLFRKRFFINLFIRLFRKPINLIVKAVIFQAYNRSMISSEKMHEIAGISDRMLWYQKIEDNEQQETH